MYIKYYVLRYPAILISSIPSNINIMAKLVIACHERDMSLSNQPIGDLKIERLLVELYSLEL